MAPNQLLQHKAQLSQPLAQHQQPSAGRRSHRTLPKDQTQLLSLQHDHRHRERERQRQREKSVAAVQKLTFNSGNTAAAAAAAPAAASSPSRSANSQRSAVKSGLPELTDTVCHLFVPYRSFCLALSLTLSPVKVQTLIYFLQHLFLLFFFSQSFFSLLVCHFILEGRKVQEKVTQLLSQKRHMHVVHTSRCLNLNQPMVSFQ